ncbi:Hypothetical predicted protein [Cloeon dipterum]|uniref:F-box domain-containing protein n=1 Tax=Cloeon dipterum TaxID=197152 RepID=A0A8S1CUQ9_9INSE|nr:Hypothetical predicted protein [Cloeon dipterum]
MMTDGQMVMTVLPTFAGLSYEQHYDPRGSYLRTFHHQRSQLRYQPYLVSHRGIPQTTHVPAFSTVSVDPRQTLLDLSSGPPQQRTEAMAPRPESPPELEQTSTHVSRLYPEILAIIFSYLGVRDKGRAAQVCTAWRDAANHKSVWRGIEAKLHLRKPFQGLFSSLGRRGIKRFQVLSMKRSLKELVNQVPNVESLNLSGNYSVTDIGLGHVFNDPLPSLTQLDLSLCKQVTDSSMGRIAQNMRNLEVLELGGCSHVTNTGLLLIAWGLTRLKRLNLRSCWQVSDGGISHICGKGLADDSDEDEYSSRAAASTYNITQHSPQPDILGTPKLEYLGLQDCQRLTDESLRYISCGLTNLKSINLSFCVSITDSGLKYLAKMPSLRELNLRACDNVTDTGMIYLAEFGSFLTSLDVSFCDKIGDLALNHLSQGMTLLRTLCLSACRISDEGLCQIARSLSELEVLHIGQCHRVTDVGVNKLADSLQKLRAIDLYGCTHVSHAALDRLHGLPRLKVLNLGLFHVR